MLNPIHYLLNEITFYTIVEWVVLQVYTQRCVSYVGKCIFFAVEMWVVVVDSIHGNLKQTTVGLEYIFHSQTRFMPIACGLGLNLILILFFYRTTNSLQALWRWWAWPMHA